MSADPVAAGIARIVNATPGDRVVAFDGDGNLVARSHHVEHALIGLSGPEGVRDLTFVGRSDASRNRRVSERDVAFLLEQYRETVKLREAGVSDGEVNRARDRIALEWGEPV